MKKIMLSVFVLIFSLSASTAFANNSGSNPGSDKMVTPDKKENKLSNEEISRLTRRVEEIRNMDKSDLTKIEKRDLRDELKGIKETVKADGGYIYIGAGTLLLILILILIL